MIKRSVLPNIIFHEISTTFIEIKSFRNKLSALRLAMKRTIFEKTFGMHKEYLALLYFVISHFE